jgi:hypothetical protein
MNANFDPPPKQLTLLAIVGGLVTATVAITGLEFLSHSLNSPKRESLPCEPTAIITHPSSISKSQTSKNLFEPVLKLLPIISAVLLTLTPNVVIKSADAAPVSPESTNETDRACETIRTPLTPEEEAYARAAWQYFVDNYQPDTGFTNSTGSYPSGTLWDMGNYLMALNSARWLNVINQQDFDVRLNQFLQELSSLTLFENSLPNKVYNTSNGQMVDYANNPVDRGIGWSALDIGRILAAFHVIRTCHPQYADWLKSIVDRWAIDRSIKDGELYGAAVLPDGQTLLVQEGRLGYEEYAVRGYELWGYAAAKAVSYEPFQLVNIYGIEVPVDTRDYQATNANNYVVSESYILDGIEFGFLGQQAQDFAARILEVQKRHYETTEELTAVTEDNIDGPPYFLYNTIFANGRAWATITEKNEPYPQFRSISTKAAFGWRYIFPDSDYAQKLFEVAKTLISPDGGGFYAGLYTETQKPNQVLTGNTNGLILEILYYKARGDRPLIAEAQVTASTGKPERVTVVEGYPAPEPSQPRSSTSSPTSDSTPQSCPAVPSNCPCSTASNPEFRIPNSSTPTVPIEPIPPVGSRIAGCPCLTHILQIPEKRYAEAAWAYFKANYYPETGLVSDRNDLPGVTLWGMGDYGLALQAADALGLIPPEEFDLRVRRFLGAIARLPLFAGELPHRSYHAQTLQPVDYGLNPSPEGNGWSGLDVGRLLLTLYSLKSCHPEYGAAIDHIVLDWSFLRVVQQGQLYSATTERDEYDRLLTRVQPETRLGYEEYAARGFQLWGFDVSQSAVSRSYQTVSVEGFQIPISRTDPLPDPRTQPYTVTTPFLFYGLELGFDPQMRALIMPILQAQAARYQHQGLFTAAGTTLLNLEPYVIHSTIVGNQKPWVTLQDNGQPLASSRVVSTAAAFAFHALFPDNAYSQNLRQSVTDLYNPLLGYYEGFYEDSGKTTIGLSSTTNSLILESLLYPLQCQKPLITHPATFNSPWWQAIKQRNTGNGLPQTP